MPATQYDAVEDGSAAVVHFESAEKRSVVGRVAAVVGTVLVVGVMLWAFQGPVAQDANAVVQVAAHQGHAGVFGHQSSGAYKMTPAAAAIPMLTEVQAVEMASHLSFTKRQRGFKEAGACRIMASIAQCAIGDTAACMRCPEVATGYIVEYCWACCLMGGSCHHDGKGKQGEPPRIENYSDLRPENNPSPTLLGNGGR